MKLGVDVPAVLISCAAVCGASILSLSKNG